MIRFLHKYIQIYIFYFLKFIIEYILRWSKKNKKLKYNLTEKN